MRRPKISLKKYFYFTIICALLLIFLYNFKEREVWKPKSSLLASSATSYQQQQQQHHLGQNVEDDYNDKYEEDDTEKPVLDNSKIHNNTLKS
ncbi:hypothetical protein DOY81_015041 [Sarcophaga bullata]|nr:hypothetical protein DOY81_015041 [Sarcophaga bullata]